MTTSLFSHYEMPLFIVDDSEVRQEIAYTYKYRFPSVKVSFCTLAEYLLLQDSEPDMIQHAHDAVVAVDVIPQRYDQLDESVIIWK